MMLPGPRSVRAALDRALQMHPYAATGRIARSDRADREARELWERLLACTNLEREAVVAALSPHQVRLVAYGGSARLRDPGAIAIVTSIARNHPFSHRLRIVFEAHLLFAKEGGLRSAALVYTESRSRPPLWQVLAESEHPLTIAADWYHASDVALNEWVSLPEVRLEWSPALHQALRSFLIAPDRVHRTLARDGLRSVQDWIELEGALDAQERWFTGYLQRDDVHRWAPRDAILDMILRRFGSPADGGMFWTRLNDEQLGRRFRRWLVEHDLTAVLGDSDRLSFWREFLPEIRRCVPTRDRAAVLIQLPECYAVQFVRTGKATYLFEGPIRHAWKELEEADLYSRVLRARSIDKYEHRGQLWRSTARHTVRKLLAGQHPQ